MSLVTVATFRDPVDAQVYKAMLEGAGIPAFVTDEHLVSTQWLYSTAVGGVKLQVDAEHLDAARDFLGTNAEGALAGVEECSQPAVDGDTCPACGSESVRASQIFRSSLALSLIANLPLFAWRSRWVCEICGHSWRMARSPFAELPPQTLDAEDEVRGRAGSYAGAALFLGFLAAAALAYRVLR